MVRVRQRALRKGSKWPFLLPQMARSGQSTSENLSKLTLVSAVCSPTDHPSSLDGTACAHELSRSGSPQEACVPRSTARIWVEETTRAQGIPVKISDPVTIRTVAAILRAARLRRERQVRREGRWRS
jgi:hypothetical protein